MKNNEKTVGTPKQHQKPYHINPLIESPDSNIALICFGRHPNPLSTSFVIISRFTKFSTRNNFLCTACTLLTELDVWKVKDLLKFLDYPRVARMEEFLQ